MITKGEMHALNFYKILFSDPLGKHVWIRLKNLFVDIGSKG